MREAVVQEATAPTAKVVYTPEELKVRQEREAVYGTPQMNHSTIGAMWAGMINQHYGKELIPNNQLPPHLVCLMQVAVKLNRLSRTENHADSWLDIHNYLKLAKEIVDENRVS